MRRPRFIALQARHAHGFLGRIVAAIMAAETRVQNECAIEALGVAPADRVLDLGCGPGRSLALLASRAKRGHVTGVDPSGLMVRIARRRNRYLIDSRRVSIVNAVGHALPFADGALDKVLCVHVIYFWDDLAENLREIARVLRPGGRLALVFRSSAHEVAVGAFPEDLYRFRDLRQIADALSIEGFEVAAQSMRRDAAGALPPHLILATRIY